MAYFPPKWKKATLSKDLAGLGCLLKEADRAELSVAKTCHESRGCMPSPCHPAAWPPYKPPYKPPRSTKLCPAVSSLRG